MKHKNIREEFREAIKKMNKDVILQQQIHFESIPASPFKSTLPDGIMIFKQFNHAVWIEFKYQYDKLSSKQKMFKNKSAAFAVIHLREYKDHYKMGFLLYIDGKVKLDDLMFYHVEKRNKIDRVRIYQSMINDIRGEVEATFHYDLMDGLL